PPFAEEILRRRNRHRCQEDQADHAERAHAISEQILPERPKFLFHDRCIPMLIVTIISMNLAMARPTPNLARGKMSRWRSAPPVRIRTKSSPRRKAACPLNSAGTAKAIGANSSTQESSARKQSESGQEPHRAVPPLP